MMIKGDKFPGGIYRLFVFGKPREYKKILD